MRNEDLILNPKLTEEHKKQRRIVRNLEKEVFDYLGVGHEVRDIPIGDLDEEMHTIFIPCKVEREEK